jgi:hypothetical protein
VTRWWSRWPVRERVLVNLVDGRAFDALLWDQAGPLLVLRDAKLIEAEGIEPVAVDGEVIVERPKVAFIQVRP